MKIRNARGITLIALIVTIVVLIIIAGISIASLTSDNGILRQTNTGSSSTTGTKLVEVAKIGDIVNYDPTTGGNVNSTNTTYTSVAGSTTVHGNGYTTDTDGQTFSAAAYKNNPDKKWRILNIEGDKITLISDPIYQDNTTNGISDGTMGSTGLYLSNGIGYIWAEEELHRIASIYGHGDGADLTQTVKYYYGGPNDQDLAATGEFVLSGAEAQQGRKTILSLDTPSGARALTVEDVNKICGKEATYPANFSGSTVTKNSNNATYYPTLSGTSSTGQSAEVSELTGSYYNTYYGYTISSTNKDTTVQTNQNTMLKPGTDYWLASRFVYTSSSDATFYVRIVNSSGNVSGISTCFCYYGRWDTNTPSYAVRAVITLKSGIQTSDTEYDGDTGWNLVK